MLLNLLKTGISGKELEARLDDVHITANKNTIPNDPASPFVTSGLRIGTPAITTRGFKEEEMKLIAGWISDVVHDFDGTRKKVLNGVQELCDAYPLY